MSLGFLVKEGLSGFTRTKTPSFVAILTIAISLTLLGGSYEIGSELYGIFQSIQSRLNMEVFLLPNATEYDRERIEQILNDSEVVSSVHYVTKEEAARRFQDEFGEDLSEVLDYNPLPTSYRVRLDARNASLGAIKELSELLRRQSGVDEVNYRQRVFGALQQYYSIFLVVGGVVLLLILLAAIFLISNTIKLSIFAKREVIEIMHLVGATDRFVKTPFVIEGVVHGIIGAGIASLFLVGVIHGTNYFLSGIVNTKIVLDLWVIGVLVAMGVVFGFVGSLRSVRLFLRRGRAVS